MFNERSAPFFKKELRCGSEKGLGDPEAGCELSRSAGQLLGSLNGVKGDLARPPSRAPRHRAAKGLCLTQPSLGSRQPPFLPCFLCPRRNAPP